MYIISIALMVFIYEIAATLVAQSFILPSIFEILHSFYLIVISPDFISIILATVIRFIYGSVISFISAMFLAIMSYRYQNIKYLLEPLYVLIKTIPNITYIIVALIWLGRNNSVILVSFLAVFPLMYNSILNGLESIDANIVISTKVFQSSFVYKLTKVYLPMAKKDIIIAIKNSLSLALRVSIMAEILSQVNIGIGKEMYFAKINYLVNDIFAWTLIIIILSALIDYLFDHLIKHMN